MVKVAFEQKLDAPAEEVWDLVGGFDSLPEFHPGVESSSLEEGGAVRRVKVKGAGIIVERMVHFDEEKRTYSYTIIGTEGMELPFTNYSSTIAVKEDKPGKSCIVEWSSSADALDSEEKAEGFMAGVCKGGFKGLREKFGG